MSEEVSKTPVLLRSLGPRSCVRDLEPDFRMSSEILSGSRMHIISSRNLAAAFRATRLDAQAVLRENSYLDVGLLICRTSESAMISLSLSHCVENSSSVQRVSRIVPTALLIASGRYSTFRTIDLAAVSSSSDCILRPSRASIIATASPWSSSSSSVP